MKTIRLTALFTTFILIFGTAFSQGEALFRQKCNTCHMVDKNSTGPWLKGVKQKWADAGEAELLYQWVKNPPALIAGGQSKMALAVKGFNAGDMPPQTVTNEEVDAILAYIDGYTTPLGDSTKITNEVAANGGTDYESNLVLFYWLFGLMIFLVFVILVMTNTIIGFVHSDFFKNKLKEKQTGKPVPGMLLLAISFGFMAFSNQGYALQFITAGETTENTPWLLIEPLDLYLILAVDILLVFVVLYLRGLFTAFLQLVSPKTC